MLHKHKILMIILSLTLVFNAFSRIHEDELGLEHSVSLREAVVKDLLAPTLEVDQEKVDIFMEKISRRVSQLFEIEKTTLMSMGEKEKKAKKESAKQDLIIAGRYIIKLSKRLKTLENPTEIQSLAKKILKIESSFVKEGRYNAITEILGVYRVLLFENHDLPLNSKGRELPSNLVNEKTKKYYSRDELRELEAEGVDLSTIDPPNNSFWAKPENVAQVDIVADTKGIPTKFFYSSVKKSDHHPKLKVYSADGEEKTKWKFMIGKQVNTEFVAMRIMELMGFKIDRMYYIKTPTVYFKDKEERDAMLLDWLGFYSAKKELPHMVFKSEGELETPVLNHKGKKYNYYVTFYEAALEDRPKDEERIGSFKLNELGAWERREVRAQLLAQGYIASGDIKEAHNNKIKLVSTGKGEYDVNELIHDLGKSLGNPLVGIQVNDYPFEWIKIKGIGGNKRVHFDYRRYHIINKFKTDKNPFMVGHYSDTKWSARLLAQITKKQLHDIITGSGFPKPLAELYYQKLLTRRDNVVRIFNLEGTKTSDNRVVQLFNTKKIKHLKKELDFDYKGEQVIKNGVLLKNFKDHGFPMQYLGVPGKIGQALVMGLQALVTTISDTELSQKLIPIDLPNRVKESTDEYKTEYFFGLITFKFHRSIETTKARLISEYTYKLTDTFQVRLNLGGKYKTLTIPFQVGVKGNAFVGREYQRIHYVDSRKKAMTAGWGKLLALPFKWRKQLAESRVHEGIQIADIIGIEEGVEGAVGIPTIAQAGVEIEAEQNVLKQTTMIKDANGNVLVADEKGPGYELGASLFTRFFGMDFLQFNHLRYGIFGGHSTVKNYVVDLANADQHMELLRIVRGERLFKGSDLLPLESEEKRDYRGSDAEASVILASRSTHKEGTKKIETFADGTQLRTLHFETERERSSMIRTISARAEAKIKYIGVSDEIDKTSITLHVDIEDPATKNEEFSRYIKLINTLVADEEFIIFTPELFNRDRYEEIVASVDIKFKKDVVACLMEKLGCPEGIEKTRKLKTALAKFHKKKRDRSRLRSVSSWIARMSMKRPEVIGEMIKYFGERRFTTKVYIFGEFLPLESKNIYRKR
ncbi:MAG: hypothetical protein HOE90_02410 [Bacteriovoracaceae bacterium]|jgi:hypothetical protein|nr:hypothetical protein [Bacteriovoracaceae bacterium]